MQTTKTLPKILLILDERLSREKAQRLMNNVNSLRRLAQIELLKGSTTQETVIEKINASKGVVAVFAPWYRYLAWGRVESLFGMTRTSGPVFAGYFADQLLPYELEEAAPGLNRALLLDFNNLRGHELLALVRAVLHEPLRSGVKPFLAASTRVHYESWLASQGMGFRLDQIMRISGVESPEWKARVPAVRLAIAALWNLIYEEGPGKSELSNAVNTNIPHAYFQVAVDERCLALRLCFTRKGWSPRDCVTAFWPDSRKPSSAAQILLRYTDLVRIHSIGDSGEIELTLLFFPSGLAEKYAGEMHTLWIDPVSEKSFTEKAYQEAAPEWPHLHPLPEIPMGDGGRGGNWGEAQVKQRDRLLSEAAVATRKLRAEIQERDDAILELRSGGVGTSRLVELPDGDDLLLAFEDRLEALHYDLQVQEKEVARLEQAGHTADAARRKIDRLQKKEQAWVQKILDTLKNHRRSAA